MDEGQDFNRSEVYGSEREKNFCLFLLFAAHETWGINVEVVGFYSKDVLGQKV